ncbi:MAG: virulence RhuM family protein [Capsulimonadaceae bacterium]
MSDQANGEIIIYQREGGKIGLEVRFEGESAWLSQQQIADLYQTSRTNVVEHIKHIFEEQELSEEATCRNFRQVRMEGSREVARTMPHYNLELILAVGYRVKSSRATLFRQWATERLSEYIKKGFTMDDAKLKELGGGSYWKELLQRIRDIRSSEKVLYRQVLDLYATSLDYNPKAEETMAFFKEVQNKLHHAAHGRTAAEVIHQRADATKPNMGLMSFTGERPRKSDVAIAKNYLLEKELTRLNSLVSAYFEAAEFRAQNHEPTYMKDWLGHLDRLIVAMDAPTLIGAGSVSHEQAVAKAETEYAKYRKQLDASSSEVERAYLETLKAAQKEVEGEQE